MNFPVSRKAFLLLACCITFSIVSANNLNAAIEHYSLSDHPNGNLAPPTYGLRLDDLQGVDNQDYTFSFDHILAEMFLDYDTTANTIHIFGKAYGGKDIGNGYESSNEGLFGIDFTYRQGVTVATSPNGLTVSPEHVNNYGTIEFLGLPGVNWQGSETIYNLTDHQGGHSDSFLFLADGHRLSNDSSTIVGRGWVNHDGDGDLSTHSYSSDWLFMAEPSLEPSGGPVPEPMAICVWGGLTMFGGLIIRRRMR